MADALAACCWVAVNALLASAAWKLAGRLFPHNDLHARLLHVLVLLWAWIVVSATALGSMGLLSGPACLAAGAAAAVAVLYGLRRFGEAMPAAPARRWRGPGRFGWLLLWCVLLALFLGHVITSGMLRFPSDWDTLLYHLPLVDRWLQSRSLCVPDFSHWYNPGNHELLGVWLAAPFSGDFLTALSNVVPVVLLVAAAGEVGRTCGLRGGLCQLTALAVAATPVLLRQAADAENDVAVAALFLACLSYGLRHAREGRAADLALAAVSLGLLAGVKYYALGYAAVAGLAVVLLALAARGWRAGVRAAAVVMAGAVGLGGYWYVRNAWAAGSPVYPLGLTPDANQLDEIYPDVWRSTLLGSGNPEVLPLLLSAIGKMGGPAYLAAVLALPLTAVWLIVAGVRGHRERGALGGAVLGAGLVLAMTPFTAETTPDTLDQLRGAYLPVRFGLCCLGLAVIGLAVLLYDVCGAVARRLKGKTSRTVACVPTALFVIAGAVQLAWAVREPGTVILPDSVVLAVDLLMLAAVVMLVRQGWPSWRRILGVTLGLAAVAGGGVAAGWLAGRWHAGFAAHYDGTFGSPVVSRLQEVAAEERICVLDYRPYRFFGSRRQFAVCQPLQVPTPSWLLDYYREQRGTLVVVIVRDPFGRGRYAGLHGWHLEHPEWFEPLERGAEVWLFRVDRSALEHAGRPPIRLEDGI